jgi:hypothetical protein
MCDDDDDGSSVDSFIEPPQEVLSPAEQHYLEKSYSPKILFAMAIGQKNEAGEALVDDTKEPYRSVMLKKKSIKPSLKTLMDEIKRRQQPGDTAPRCRNWSAEECQEWLIRNPITDETDVAFLKKQCMDFHDIAVAAALETQELARIWNKRKANSMD